MRNVNSVSTAALLRPDDRERHKGDVGEKTGGEEMPMAIVTTKEREQRKKNKNVAENEELSRSPSFRVYFSDATPFKESDEDPVKVIKRMKEERLAKENERIQANEDKEKARAHVKEQNTDLLISRQGSSNKPLKKERGRRFRALTKASGRVFGLLSVRSCYCPSTSSDAISERNLRSHAIEPS